MEEIKDYLFTEGTCKCGLDCPLAVESLFDFSPQVSQDYPSLIHDYILITESV